MERIDTPPDLQLGIDENVLDNEWQGHAEQAFAWGRYAAVCRHDFDEKKNAVELVSVDLKRVMAEVDDDIRRDPEVAGLSLKGGDGYIKMTETVMGNKVVLHPRYGKAQKKLHDARSALSDSKYSLDVAEAAVSALKDRKHGLQDIVQLHISGYCGAPRERTARGDNDTMDDEEKRALRRGTRDRRRQTT